MRCKICDADCGLNNITDGRCCFYCEFKNNCRGFCVTLESEGDFEEVAKSCSGFIDDEI